MTPLHRLRALGAVPFALWRLRQIDAAIMKPLDGALVIVAAHHLTVRDLVAEAVARFVRVAIPVYGGRVFPHHLDTTALIGAVVRAPDGRVVLFLLLVPGLGLQLSLLHPRGRFRCLLFGARRSLSGRNLHRSQGRVAYVLAAGVQRVDADSVRVV